MPKIEWEDSTSYSQKERNDTNKVPRCWQCHTGVFPVIVHRVVHLDNWYLSCYSLNINTECLNTTDLEEAKKLGVQKIIDELNKKVKDYKDSIKYLKG